MHFMDDVVVEGIGHVFKECQAIDVKGRIVEAVITHPTGTRHIGCCQVEGLHWVIEICKINRCISLGDWLELRLGNEKFVFLRREMFTLGSVQIGIHTINLWCRSQVTQTRTALDSQFNIMILESNEREGFGPIFTEEEWDYVMISGGPTDTLRVIGYLGGSAEQNGVALLTLALGLPALIAAALMTVKFAILPLLQRFDDFHEYIFLLAIGWCLAIAQVAHLCGLSYEEGGFIAGVSLATSPIAQYIANHLKPLRDFFLVMFFFTVGASINLQVLPSVWMAIVSLAAAILLI